MLILAAKMLTLRRFWAFFYVQHRHDIRESEKSFWAMAQMLIHSSPCSKLHHSYNHFFGFGDVDDLGLLRQVILHDQVCRMTDVVRLRKSERRKNRLKGFDDCCGSAECCAKLLLFFPTPHCLHGLWSCQAQSRQNHDLCALAGSSSLLFWLDLLDSKLGYHT